MKVVLLENLRNLGSIGEIISVKRGYARNFLIPQKKALFASEKNIKDVDKIKSDLNKKDQEKRKSAKEISDKLKDKTFEVKKLVTEIEGDKEKFMQAGMNDYLSKPINIPQFYSMLTSYLK